MGISSGITSGSISYDKPVGDKLLGSLKKQIIPGSLTHMFSNDVWVRKFVLDITEIFGLPSTSQTCTSKKDRYLFAFGLMSVTAAMRRMDSTWRAMYKKKVDPKDAAWEFCRRFFERYGAMVIESPLPHEQSVPGMQLLNVTSLKKLQSLPSGSGR